MDLYPDGTYITTPGLGLVSRVSGEIDLRRELHVILNGDSSELQRGHWVVYRRFDLSRTSQYYNQVTGEGKGGPMYEYVDELWLTRKVLINSRSAVFAAEQEAKPGIITVPYVTYYFPHTLNPKQEDEIYELNIEDHSTRPTSYGPPYRERLDIKLSQDLRDINGRIEYWTVIVQSTSTKW